MIELFSKKKIETRCKCCNLECVTVEKLARHKAIAHQQHDTSREARRALQKGKQFSF